MLLGRDARTPEGDDRTRRMSQSELAETAGVTNSAISDYERGKVDPQAATLRELFRQGSLTQRTFFRTFPA